MRLLLDGCVPKPFGRALPEHEVRHVSELGWDDLDDGLLLERMAGHFDALLTVDRNLRYQQRIAHRPFSVVVLRVLRNRVPELLPLVPAVREALATLRPGEIRELGG